MEPIIQLLDSCTINQIAAGEVIENPASVIKELVENSLDARATKVCVTVQAGGLEYIRVQDDGIGMHECDALLAIERHATSKIKQVEDIFSISTMGFRGEALASIAAISEFTLTTAMHTEEVRGTRIVVKGGSILSKSGLYCLPGTVIEVRSLFFNTPARYKFQKSPKACGMEVVKQMTSIALAHPEIEFELMVNGKKEFHLERSSQKERVRALLGEQYVSEARALVCEENALAISGFIGAPSMSRPTRTGQYLFINRRPVFSLALSKAIKDGYGSSIEPLHHPSFVLNLTIHGDEIDINVHPQKKEIRFKNEQRIKKQVADAVEKALFQTRGIQEPPKEETEQEDIRYTHITSPAASSAFSIKGCQTRQAPLWTSPPPEERVKQEEAPVEAPVEAIERPKELFTGQEIFRVVGAYDEYILVESTSSSILPTELTKPGLLIINCKAALARIAFEDLQEVKTSETVQAVQLLTPIFMELAHSEAHILTGMLPELSRLGFDIREFGKMAFLIESHPAHIAPSALQDFILELVHGNEEAATDMVKVKRCIAKTAAAHAHRGKYPVDHELASLIIKRLFSCRQPLHCPFGQATCTLLSKEEMEKRF